MPFHGRAVWNYYCAQKDMPVGASWIDEAKKYEKTILSKRNG